MLCHIDREAKARRMLGEISFNILKLLRFLAAYNPAYPKCSGQVAGLEMTTL